MLNFGFLQVFNINNSYFIIHNMTIHLAKTEIYAIETVDAAILKTAISRRQHTEINTKWEFYQILSELL